MPAAVKITDKQRSIRAARLAKAIGATGPSRRAIARAIADQKGATAASVETNLKRWMADQPRTGAVDAAPDWIFEAIANLKAKTPDDVERELHAAIERGYVSMKLAESAANLISNLKKKGPGR